MKTVCLKLSSGEEIIGRQVEETAMLCEAAGDGVQPLVMQDVHIINLIPMKNQEFGINFIPWAMGAAKGTQITINRDHVTSYYEPVKDLESGFLQHVSGFQIATAGSSLPGMKM